MEKTKILVVEDERIVARAIQGTLKSHGYDVGAIASTGAEAIQKTVEMKPDLVLMDIVLKGDMDGIEAAEQIRSRFDIPVVYLTAYTNGETIERAKITEPFGYITKPFEEKQLHTNIEMALYKHKMDKALRKSKSEKELILSSLSELIVYHDKNLRIVWANRAAGEAAGRPTNQMVGHYCYEVWYQRQEPCVGCPVVKSIEIGEPVEGEITTPDGRILQIHGYPVRDEQGEVAGVVMIALDITERKRAEEALKESEERYKALFKGAPDGIIVADVETGQYIHVNPSICKILGYSEEEIKGLSQFRGIHPKGETDKIKRLFFMQARGEIDIAEDIPFVKKDGTIRYFDVNSVCVEIDGIQRVIGLLRDITERKHAEEALKESEEKYSTLVEQAKDGIVIVQDKGDVKFANKALLNLLGYSEKEMHNKHFLDLVAPESKKEAVETYTKRMKGEQASNLTSELKLLCKDGSKKDIEASSEIIQYQGKPANLSIVRDITERKKAEQKLVDYQAQLRSLASERLWIEEKERRRLARGLHDNIGQELALAKMRLQSSMASARGSSVAAELDKVCRSIDRIMEEAHSLTFELSSPVLYEVGLVAAVEQWLAEEIRQKHGIRYKLAANVKSKDFDHELSATVFRVVRELLINVIKHAKAKNIRVGIKELKGALSVAIEDDGVGFDVAKFAKALRKGKKTKFGLFSAKEQLDFLGGKFRIESVPQKGTKVSLTVPLKR